MFGHSSGHQGPACPRQAHEARRSWHCRRSRWRHARRPRCDRHVPPNGPSAEAPDCGVIEKSRAGVCRFSKHLSCARGRHSRDAQEGRARPIDALISAANHDRFVDDLTGLPLPPELCRAARQQEIAYFRAKGVWEMRPFGVPFQSDGSRLIRVTMWPQTFAAGWWLARSG